MVTIGEKAKQAQQGKKIKLPQRFTPQKKMVQPTQQTTTQTIQVPATEKDYIQQYGEYIGKRIFQLLETQKQLEQSTDQEEKKNLQKTIAFINKDLKALAKPKKETITPQTPDLTGGYTIATGGSGYISPDKYLKQFETKKTTPDYLVASSVKGKEVFITKEGKVIEQIPANFPAIPPTVPASSLPEERYLEKKPIKQPKFLLPKEALTKKQVEELKKVVPQKEQETSRAQRFISSREFLKPFQLFSEKTDELTRETGKFVGKGLTPTVLIGKDFEIKKTPKERIEKAQLTTTQLLASGQYFIPFYGEAKGASDILSEVKKREDEKIASELLLGAGFAVGIKTAGKGFSFLSNKFGKTAEYTKPSLGVKAIDKFRTATELAVPTYIIGSQTVGLIEKQKELESGVPFESIQKQTISESKSIPSILLGERVGRAVLSKPKEFILKLKKAEKIEAEEIVEPKVLSGEKTFPMSKISPAKLVKKFNRKSPFFEGKGAFTATRSQVKQLSPVDSDKSETSGLYVSPTPSIFFLRIKGLFDQPKYSLRPKFLDEAGEPILFRPTLKEGVEELPKRIQRAFGSGKVRLRKKQSARPPEQTTGNIEFKKLPKGKAYVSPQFTFKQKSEEEAVVVPGTKFLYKPLRYYTKIKGEAVPIYEGLALTEAEAIKTTIPQGKILTSEQVEKLNRATERYLERKTPIPPLSSVSRTKKNGSFTNPLKTSSFPLKKESIVQPERKTILSKERPTARRTDRISSSERPVVSKIPEYPRIIKEIHRPVPSYPPNPPRRPPPPPPERIYNPREPPTPPRVPPPPPRYFERRGSIYKQPLLSRAYGVLTRIKGKEVLLPGLFTKKEALEYGKIRLTQGKTALSASLKVVPREGYATPKGIRAPNIQLIKGKKGFLIQPIGTRLGSLAERKNIQEAKKNYGFKIVKRRKFF